MSANPTVGLRDSALLAGLLDNYWAMEPQILGRMVEVILRHAQGVRLEAREIDAIVAARPDGGDTPTEVLRRGQTAIVPITGVLVKHAYLVNGESQARGTATLEAGKRLEAAVADPGTSRIVLLIDSPGGSVFGIADLADAIRRADAVKPVIAMIEDIGASGAYWLGSQARQVLVNSTGMVGSIGVYTVMIDASRRAEQMGLRFDLVKAGQHKGIGTAGVSVSEEDRRVVQDEVDALYEHFIAAVAAGRGLSPQVVRELADGRVHIGQRAVGLGLADGVTTLEALLSSLDTQPTVTGRPGVPAAGGSRIVAAGDQESEMSDKTKDSPPVAPAADVEALRAAATQEANQAAAQRVRDLAAALGGRTELLSRAIAEGMDVTAAKAQLADVLAAENQDLAGQLTAVQSELASLKQLAATAGIKPLAVGGTGAAEGDGEEATAYEQAVAARREQLIAKGAGERKATAQAYADVAREHPAWHAAWKQHAAEQTNANRA